jgi:hypothetical protein|tara:strand:+ start:98 stop:781 length:684 start_codon:yes stop_codon:yes gene_type:complete
LTPWITKPIPFNIGQGAAAGSSVVTPDFETDFPNADLWTEVGTDFNIASNKANNGGAGNSSDQRLYLTSGLGFTLSNSLWSIRFTYKITTAGGGIGSGVPLYVSDSVAKPLTSSLDMIGVNAANPRQLATAYNSGSGFSAGTESSALTSGTEYYIQLQRTSTTATSLTIYTDDTFETEFQSPITQAISSSIQDLDQLAISSTDNGSKSTPQNDWYIADLKVYDSYNF